MITVAIHKIPCKWTEIRKKQREFNMGKWLGWYSYSFDCGNLVYASIRYLDLWLFGKHTLRHELGHHAVTMKCSSFEEAVMMNKEYDKITLHGIMQWRYKE